MAKQVAEWSNKLSVSFLKKNGYLQAGWQHGSVRWSYGEGGNESGIGFAVSIDGNERDNIRLQYSHTNNWTGEKESMDYKVWLDTTPCHFGGQRYWFICPLSRNGQSCNRRVGTLFSIGKWFGCRHCGDICYQSQLEGGRYRVGSVTEPDVERAYREVKRQYYNGKPTRKYKRYLRMCAKMDDSWLRFLVKVNNRL